MVFPYNADLARGPAQAEAVEEEEQLDACAGRVLSAAGGRRGEVEPSHGLTECGGDGDEGRDMQRVGVIPFVCEERADGLYGDDEVHGAHSGRGEWRQCTQGRHTRLTMHL